MHNSFESMRTSKIIWN